MTRLVDPVAVVLGTRPEAIKLAGIVRGLGDRAWVIHTGQHYDAVLGGDVLADVGFPAPHVHLAVGGSSRGVQIGAALQELDAHLAEVAPAAVVVQGDTNATVAAALAANARDLPLVHVEAGLRSFDRAMPEEHNRVVVDHLADLCCAPTEVAAGYLRNEAIPAERIVVTGNTVVEAVADLLPDPAPRQVLVAALGLVPDGYLVATIHRPENTDDPAVVARILVALADAGLPVVLPLHPRTRHRLEAFGLGSLLDPLVVVDPLPPRDFLALAAEARGWVSDSGGLQEEASVLRKPLVVVRRSTERPEVLGTFAHLVAPGADLLPAVRRLVVDPSWARSLASLPCPYGDGTASDRILEELARLTQQTRPLAPVPTLA